MPPLTFASAAARLTASPPPIQASPRRQVRRQRPQHEDAGHARAAIELVERREHPRQRCVTGQPLGAREGTRLARVTIDPALVDRRGVVVPTSASQSRRRRRAPVRRL